MDDVSWPAAAIASQNGCMSSIASVDHGQPPPGADLDQAELRPVGVLGDELRVDGDRLHAASCRQ